MTENPVAASEALISGRAVMSPRRLILPLALAQFICSFAGSNMNVMITDISDDLDTTVKGVQTAITLFLLIMAILMIPCSKLTDRWGRKRCFIGGPDAVRDRRAAERGVSGARRVDPRELGVRGRRYGAVDPARLHPRDDVVQRSHLASVGLRCDQRPGRRRRRGRAVDRGLITTGISWRAAFVFQAAVVATIILLSRRLVDPLPPDLTRPFDAVGAILSAVGMFFVVFGILQAGTNNVLLALFLVVGVAFLIGFYLYIRARERAGKEPLLSTGLFRNRTSNLALVTQNMQWLLLMGVSFVVSVFLQTVRGYSAIGTGVVFTAATVGVLVSSFAAERLAKKYPQRTLIVAGFVVTLAGIGLLLGFVHSSSRVVAFVPGLLLIGLGLGAMLTPSVNVVQSSFPEALQGEISGLSRSVSNLGSTFGTAIAGTIWCRSSQRELSPTPSR